jgi:hypothetical protein
MVMPTLLDDMIKGEFSTGRACYADFWMNEGYDLKKTAEFCKKLNEMYRFYCGIFVNTGEVSDWQRRYFEENYQNDVRSISKMIEDPEVDVNVLLRPNLIGYDSAFDIAARANLTAVVTAIKKRNVDYSMKPPKQVVAKEPNRQRGLHCNPG